MNDLLRAWVTAGWTIAVVVSAACTARAQSYASGPYQMIQPPYAAPAAYLPGPGAMISPPPAPMGPAPAARLAQLPPGAFSPVAAPAPTPAPQPQAMGYYPAPAGPAWCPACGGRGCNLCMTRRDDFEIPRVLALILPYSEGGLAAPRWYDVHAEFLSLKRDDTIDYIPFTSDGPRGLGDPAVVLSTRDFDFDHEAGVRLGLAYQVTAGGSLEFDYMGTFNWASQAVVTSPLDELFSVFSDFGNNPPPTGPPDPITLGGFTDTDAAQMHAIEYSSSLDSFELNFRRRWAGPNGRLQGSWLVGVRYLILDENFRHTTEVDYQDPNDPGNPNARITGGMQYTTDTYNSLTGFQTGGDLWATIIPGLMVGGDLKAGIYGNRVDQGTTIYADTLADPVFERVEKGHAAFVGEANLMFLYRLTYSWTIRGGYQLLYITGVALAPENFNATPPNFAGAPADARTASLDANGDAFYHGLTIGAEWMW